jgi:16S rRNA (guanine966-N2)-methyltransferase
MTRIVGGTVGGRRLAVPPGRDVRPTSDRTREALFDTLGTMLDLSGVRVLDLYAGSGAVGLEAVSRGAAYAVLVEADPRAASAARANAEALGIADRVQVIRDRVEHALLSPHDADDVTDAYHLAFADPPYALSDAEVDRMLRLLASGWLAPDAVVVVERASRGAGPKWPSSLQPVKQRRYGEGTLWYGRRI